MLVFSKDIRKRDHAHPGEATDTALADYMQYQRALFPYTVVRAGLDFAYKELDDILRYVDNDHQPPPDVSRQDFPADVPAWYQKRFPWTAAFMTMEDMHGLMVRLIKAMDSFRTLEVPNAWHLTVLYDTTHNIVGIYNDALENGHSVARDIHLSKEVPVRFEDFINNYWPHLEFMLLSKPDYAHAPLMERNFLIEDFVTSQIADGLHPLEALKLADEKFHFHPGTLELLRRDEITPGMAELPTLSVETDVHAETYAPAKETGLSPADESFARNCKEAIPG